MKWNETASSVQIWADLILLHSPVKLICAAPTAELPEWGTRRYFHGAASFVIPALRARSSYKWLFAIMHKRNTISLSIDFESKIDGESLHQSGTLSS